MTAALLAEEAELFLWNLMHWCILGFLSGSGNSGSWWPCARDDHPKAVPGAWSVSVGITVWQPHSISWWEMHFPEGLSLRYPYCPLFGVCRRQFHGYCVVYWESPVFLSIPVNTLCKFVETVELLQTNIWTKLKFPKYQYKFKMWRCSKLSRQKV